MSQTVLEALMLVLVGAAGFCIGHAFASSPLRKLGKRLGATEVASAKLFAMLTADVCDLKRRMDEIDGDGKEREKASRQAPVPPPPRPTDPLRRCQEMSNDGTAVPKAGGRS